MLYFLFTCFSQLLFVYHLFVKSIFIAENWDSFMLAQKKIFFLMVEMNLFVKQK